MAALGKRHQARRQEVRVADALFAVRSDTAQCTVRTRRLLLKTVKQESNNEKSSLKSVKFQVSKAVKHDGDAAGTERMSAKLNEKCEIYFSVVDTMASKSVVTEGTLDKLRLEMPVAAQRLKRPVRFQLADDSEVQCREIAYVDFSISTERRPINLQAVALFALSGPKGDILLGKATRGTRANVHHAANGARGGQFAGGGDCPRPSRHQWRVNRSCRKARAEAHAADARTRRGEHGGGRSFGGERG